MRLSDVYKALDSGDFDDIPNSELDDSSSEGEEPMTCDVIVNNDDKVNMSAAMCQSYSHQPDPCFKDSLLLDDAELNSDSDSEVENNCNVANCNDAVTTGQDSDCEPSTSAGPSHAQTQKRRPVSRVGGRTHSRKQEQPVWNSSFQDIQPLSFSATPGPSRIVHRCQTPLDFFMLFFTSAVCNLLVLQTNLYYSQSIASKPSTMEWVNVSVEDMMAFMGLVIAMGVVRLPEMDDYWSTDPIMQHPWFTSIMSRTRFKQILRYLHCADNSHSNGSNSTDKLRKLRDIVDMLNVSFRQMYTPSQCLSVDESMVDTKCRISFLQYMPKKPKKFGIKLWALCESVTGYCLQFQVYTGKVETSVEHGLAYRVVFDLMKHYLDQGYKLFMDNFYSSFQLYVDLLKHKTGACGTVRSNRLGFPKQLQGKMKMKRGEAKFLQCKEITAVRWFDKRDVFALSSLHGNEMVAVTCRGNSEPVNKPKLIADYNVNMSGVDRCDQLLVYYALNRKTTKWWKRLFFRLLDMSVINAMILYVNIFPEKGKERQCHKKFRMELAHQLVQPLLDSYADPFGGRPSGRNPVTSDIRLKGKHFPISRQPKRSCVVCAYEKNASGKYKQTKTVNYCEKYVCRNCFEVYHTRSSYQ